MADRNVDVDAQQLASALLQAKAKLDSAVEHLRSPTLKTLHGLRSLEDNNTGCNTACNCSLAERELGLER